MAKLLAGSEDENSSLKTIQGEECEALIFQQNYYGGLFFMAHYSIWH